MNRIAEKRSAEKFETLEGEDDGFWTGQKRQALDLIWEGEKTNAQIAAALGIGERTLNRWKASPSFQSVLRARQAAWWHGLNVRLDALWSGRAQR